ncbi:hypothetical protein CRENBAI_025009 [Crenichthys baileyi]|uniref:Uncharacterized protein n=1 Tax=Crenichthys baileyi TaxID=28760 RepID=A0AAV9RHL9_9TELE
MPLPLMRFPGWGDETGDSVNPKASETLNQVALPVVPYDTCKRMDYSWFQVKTSMICCRYTQPDELQSVCQGDSGGPLVCQDTPGGPWEVHASGCGGLKDLTGDDGTISSLDYPSTYSNNPRCQWNIEVPAGKLVNLHFSGFSLEKSQLCMNDKVSLTDSVGSLGTYCSHVAPGDLVSDGNKSHISFSCNEKVVDTGFTLTWRAVDPTQAH